MASEVPGLRPMPTRRGPPPSLSSWGVHRHPWLTLGDLAKETAAGPGPPRARGPGPGCSLLLKPQGVLSQGPWNVEVPPSLPVPALPRGQPGTEPPEITRSG